MAEDHRWTIRGIHPDLQAKISERATIERRTVGEIVTEALAAWLKLPVAADVNRTLLERVNALEQRLNEMSAERPSPVSQPVEPPPATVVTETRPVRRPPRTITPGIVEQVWQLSDQGVKQKVISQKLDISQGTVSNILREGRPDA